MKIKLIEIGKTDEKYLKEGIVEYVSRLNHYVSFETITIPDSKASSPDTVKTDEEKAILQKLSPGDHVILLDDKGDEFTSLGFSKFLQKKMNAGLKTLVFVIGGPFGFSEAVYKRSNGKLSLSRMTFSHQMVRLFFCEQLYRAFTILKGEKYHHE